MFYSPLRYPGGKNKLSGFLAKICIDNRISGHYIEPYCGGASVALFLLFEGFVNHITINDKDESIYSFWHSVLYDSEALCKLIETTEVNLDNWDVQKKIQEDKKSASTLQLGFSTLFLNRTNRSGILTGGMIGGRKQTGQYDIACRFNKSEIIRKIKSIAARRDDITLYNLDALNLIDKIKNCHTETRTILYFDPPYYLKAEQLYMNHYKYSDHAAVAKKISEIENLRWIVSYDNHEEIKSLYRSYESKEYTFNHSAYTSKQGKEILFFSPGLAQPNLPHEWNPVDFKMVKNTLGRKIVFRPTKPKVKLNE